MMVNIWYTDDIVLIASEADIQELVGLREARSRKWCWEEEESERDRHESCDSGITINGVREQKVY